MAIALDAQSTGPLGFGATATWAHTCSGSNRILIVHLAFVGGSGPGASGITYNGVAMTLGQSVTSGGIKNEWWYLMSPATGANNIVATFSGTISEVGFKALSFTGVDTGSAPASAGSASGTSSGATFAGPVGFNADYGVWCIAYIESSGLGGTPSAPATGLTNVALSSNIQNSGGGSGINRVVLETYGALAGLTTPTITSNGGGMSYTFTSNGLYFQEASTDIFIDVEPMEVSVTQAAAGGQAAADVQPVDIAVTMSPAIVDAAPTVEPMEVSVTMQPVTVFLDVPPIFPGGFTLNVPTFRRRFIWPPAGLFRGN